MRKLIRRRLEAARLKERPVKVQLPLRKPVARVLEDPRRELTPQLIAEARREARQWPGFGGPYAQRGIA